MSNNSDIQQIVFSSVPWAKWEIVDVLFPTTPDTDCAIRHSLNPANPKDVHYTVVRQTTGGTVYEAVDGDAQAWENNFIVLRSDTADWKGRLLLGVLKTPDTFDPVSIGD